MNMIELKHALSQLRLGGIAAVLETRLHQAQAEPMAPIDLISCLVSDELMRRSDRLLERRRKEAQFRDSHATLDNFDFNFNMKTPCFSVHRARARVTWLKPSDWQRFNKAFASSTAKRTPCSTISPMPPSMGRANNTWNCYRPCPCSLSTISACANSRRRRQRNYSRS